MLKHLLFIGALACVSGTAYAQCTPNPLYADSLYGIWPDTTDNFAAGVVGEPYLQQIDLIVPADAGLVDPTFAGVTLDSIVLNNVVGLPPGLGHVCASHTSAPCTYLTGQLGCAVITGTPTTSGTYPLTLSVTAYTNLFGVALPIQQDFGGYRIVVSEAVGIADLGVVGLGAVRNVPNPFSSRTVVEFQLARASDVKLRIFNLLGEELWSARAQGKAGINRIPFESATMQEGVYLYKVESGRETFTGRMMLNR